MQDYPSLEITPPNQISYRFDASVVEGWQAIRGRFSQSDTMHYWRYRNIDLLDVLVSPICSAVLNSRRTLNSGERSIAGVLSVGRFEQRVFDRLRTASLEAQTRFLSRFPEKTLAIFCPREPTHVRVQAPVARELVKRQIESIFFANETKTARHLRAAGVPFSMMRKIPRRHCLSARAEGEKRKNILLKSEMDFKTIVPNETLRSALVTQLPRACEIVETAYLMLEQFSPQVLMIGNDLTAEGRALAILAKDYKVKTATMMHGALGTNPMKGLHVVDKILVYGPTHRCDLVSSGISEERITVCGAPYLDAPFPAYTPVSSKIRSFLNLAPGERYVLVATSGPGYSVSLSHHRKIIRALMELSAAMPQIKFVAKLHRKDRLEHYSSADFQVSKSRVIVVPNDHPALPSDIFEWLRSACVLLTGGSTTAIEAMALDIPVITMDFADELGHVDFINEKATLHAKSAEELRRKLDDVLLQSIEARRTLLTARKFVEGQFGNVDGRSSLRCADAIVDLMKSDSGERSSLGP